jgi:hypothetical protein
MAEPKERRKTPRKAAPKAEGKSAPRKTVAEERSVALDTSSTGREAATRNQAATGNGLSPEEMRKLIEEAAYYRAKRRGFEPGHELEDWIQAESEVTARLNGRQ